MAQAVDTTNQFHGSEQGPSEGSHPEILRPPNEDLPPQSTFRNLLGKIEAETRQKIQETIPQPPFRSLPAEPRQKIQNSVFRSLPGRIGAEPRQKIQESLSHPLIRSVDPSETVLEPPGKKRQVETDVDDFSSSQTEVPARGEVQDPNIEFSSQSSSEAVGAQSQDDLYQSHHEHNQAFRVLSDHLEVEQCLNSDAYQQTNVRYNREDESSHQEHALEDRFFSFKLWDFHVYGVFDGHDGSRASEFATIHLPRFLSSQLRKTEMTDEEIQSALKFAIEKVDGEFFSQLSGLIAERMSLQFEMEVY